MARRCAQPEGPLPAGGHPETFPPERMKNFQVNDLIVKRKKINAAALENDPSRP